MKAEVCFKCGKTSFCKHFWAAHGTEPKRISICAACLEGLELGYEA